VFSGVVVCWRGVLTLFWGGVGFFVVGGGGCLWGWGKFLFFFLCNAVAVLTEFDSS